MIYKKILGYNNLQQHCNYRNQCSHIGSRYKLIPQKIMYSRKIGKFSWQKLNTILYWGWFFKRQELVAGWKSGSRPMDPCTGINLTALFRLMTQSIPSENSRCESSYAEKSECLHMPQGPRLICPRVFRKCLLNDVIAYRLPIWLLWFLLLEVVVPKYSCRSCIITRV